MSTTATNPLAALAQAQQANQLANQLIRSQAIEMYTQLPPVVLSATTNNAGQVVNITPRNVGLLKGFFIEYNATIKNTNASAALIPYGFCGMNFFSNVMFTDLQNNVRVNCPGYQLAFLNSIKTKGPAGVAILKSAFSNVGTYGESTVGTVQGVVGIPTIWNIPTTIAAGATGVLTGFVHVPISYSDHDYRGAIYANVINGQMSLQLTLNPVPGFLTGGSQALSIMGPADNANSMQILSSNILVTQVYMDQLPIDPKSGLPILPQRDISTIYELKNTTFTGATSGNDFPMQYPNFRDVLSSILVLDSPTASPTPQMTNYFSLQAANSTNIWKRTPSLNALLTRAVIGTDFPGSVSYFSYRAKPLSTTQYGNLQLIYNPSSSWTNTSPIYHAWESFASIATITQAGSLAAGG
jgi:hypothetical protein